LTKLISCTCDGDSSGITSRDLFTRSGVFGSEVCDRFLLSFFFGCNDPLLDCLLLVADIDFGGRPLLFYNIGKDDCDFDDSDFEDLDEVLDDRDLTTPFGLFFTPNGRPRPLLTVG
jgi:hypothetical protein